MVRYLRRSCPRCNGHVGIIVREPERNTPLQAVNGHCLRCSYRMAWIVVAGNRAAPARKFSRKHHLDHPLAGQSFASQEEMLKKSTAEKADIPKNPATPKQ